jgi:O-antigen/teichoic acid export membrane protein
MTLGEDTYSGRRTVRNAWQFLVGKGFSALCTVSLLGFIVRFLPLTEYAIYISAVAALEAGIVLSSLGIDWVIIRYVPQYVVSGPYIELRRFLVIVVFVRLVSMLAFAGAAATAMLYFAPGEFVGRSDALVLLAALFVSEGLLRLLRDNALESLANQFFTQLCIALRQGAFLALLAGSAAIGIPASVETVLTGELAASLLALMFAVYFVYQTIRPIQKRPANANWKPPGFLEIRRTAWHNYAGNLLSYPYSLQALVLLVVTIEGPTRAALFGFVVRIVEILRGYLPALLLMNVLRPRLFGVYERTGQFEQPASEARLISRLSFFTVFPILVITAQYGNWLIQTASGGRFHEGEQLFFLFALSLVFRVQRQMATLLINCVKLSSLLVRNAVYSLLAFPIFVLLITVDDTPRFAAYAVVWDEVLWTLCSAALLKAAGYKWSADILLMAKLAFVSWLCFFCLSILPMPPNFNGVLLSSIFIALFYCLYLYLFQPLGLDGARVKGIIFGYLRKAR